jgi:tetratricopeptide (TPR) repeat protein
VEAALAYAVIGDTQQARTMADELNRRYPSGTQVQSLWLPAIHAQLALNQKKPGEAIDQLHRALPPIEYGQIQFINQISCLYPTYIRGQAYLAAGQSKEAAAEFQKILDRSVLLVGRAGLARCGPRECIRSKELQRRRCRPRQHPRPRRLQRLPHPLERC